MTWILILVVHWGYGTATIGQEFTSESKCKLAGEVFKEQGTANSQVWYNCVEK